MADFMGSILELKGNRATVITDKCDFLVIKRTSGMFVGQQVSFNKSDICTFKKSYTKYLAIAASICLMVCSYFLYYQFYMPSKVFAYIDVDINPSVEFAVDKDKHVVSVKPLNEDAKPLLNGGNFNKLLITEAIEELIKECEENGFIKPENETEILISGSPDSDSEKNQNKLDGILSEINSKIKQDNSKVNPECIKVKPDERALAVKNNISMGRFALFNKIREDDESITVEQAKSSKVSEIIDKANGKSHKDKDTDSISNTGGPEDNSVVKKSGEAKGSKGYSEDNPGYKKGGNEKKDNESIQNYPDRDESKKENDSGANVKPKNNSEVKGNSEKSDSRNNSGAAVTAPPETDNDQVIYDSDNGRKNSGDKSKEVQEGTPTDLPNDTEKDNVKNQDKHTDNSDDAEVHKGNKKK